MVKIDGRILNIGDVVQAVYHSTFTGNPVVRHEDHLIEIVPRSNGRFSEESNAKRMELHMNEGAAKIKIIGKPEAGVRYAGVCYIDAPASNGFSASDAHSVVAGERVIHAQCYQMKIEPLTLGDMSFSNKIFRVEGYMPSEERIQGFLKGINERRRPLWEWTVPRGLILAESKIAIDLLHGSEKFGFTGIGTGDRLLVRVVGDNKHMGKNSITYFFEPVITLRQNDYAHRKGSTIDMITGITDHNDETIDRIDKGYAIHHLPIISKFNTEKFGTVGVGYIKRPDDEESDRRPFYLKKVWILDGADQKIVERAEIVANKGVVIAKTA